ncbi:MAG: selenocysteine-specific translation elongation factor [Thermoanaerobaculaceae bacterium]|nr:selenocysteine-specific translation elongation factor [Thermoanaerobaculaceae bacterium]
MRPVVFGTAGHIDHGKTSLVRALTGVDCDRLPEEKRRGITLVLGFAPMVDPAGEVEVSFIDVPGHERLVHTMIAGAGGIDRALLVVAADEGMMPQTREHLEVLGLLAVPGGVVALNKADLLDDDLLELQREEIAEALAGTVLAGAPIVPCSAATGAGIPELREALLACARGVVRERSPHRPFRLAVDRTFTVAGTGTVVTGTARWGAVAVGDEVRLLPSGTVARVRTVQVHGRLREVAQVGERVALGLAGLTLAEAPRGEQVLGGGDWRSSRRLAVQIELLPGAVPLEEGSVVSLHLLAARVLARVERIDPRPLPGGGTGRAVLRLARPVFAAPGDRVVLRRPSPAATVGGGLVLDPQPPRLRRREAAVLAELPRPWADVPAALERWIREAGVAGVTPGQVASRLGVVPAGVEAPLGQLLVAGAVIASRSTPPLLVHRIILEALAQQARQVVSEAGPAGVPVAELLSRLAPGAPETLRALVLETLRRAGVLRETSGRAFGADATPLEDGLAARIEEVYRESGVEAPSPGEVAVLLGAKEKVVEGLVRFLVDQKRLARVGGKWILHRRHLDAIAASLLEWDAEVFDVGQFKDRFALTRKLAIPILEWLDSERVTRREGDRRRIVRRRAGTPSRD